ncbi:MAG TPA: hypothetical protein VFE36_14345, partial [Candidatus Baltobacteraceae bacterium]|nr:hypothetical protein [Candidatus Baltobacteraceae bacterium]
MRAWELDCVRELEVSGLAQLALVVRHGGIPNRYNRAYDDFAERSGARTQGVYAWLELARKTESILTVDPDIDDSAWIDPVREAGLDFILLFGPGAIGAPFERSSRYGVWTFAHGDLARYEALVPGFWELYQRRELTAGFLLKQSGRENGGIPLKSAYLATVRHSFQKNADAICSLMAKWPALVCRNIQEGVADYFADAPLPKPPRQF